jgi:hypothetical protein
MPKVKLLVERKIISNIQEILLKKTIYYQNLSSKLQNI